MTSQSIVDAYQKKYEDDDEIRGDSDIQLVFVKRKQFKLCNLILDNCEINETGLLCKVEDICSKVTECDLSHNNMSDWNEIFKLLDVGRKIQFLNLSSNVLGTCNNLPNTQYTALQCLVLCGNGVQWENILALLPCLPSLTDLNIGHNNISALPCLTGSTFPALAELNLIQNNISSFVEVSDLSETFPNLQTLVLSDNPLKSFGDDEKLVANFKEMKKLHVNNITINSWEEVSKLRWFPVLTDVRMVHWDLFGEMKEDATRNMLGALLPNIHLINGAPIPDREIAERWYIRKCKADGETDNRRYKELYEKYGELPELGDISLGYESEVITLNLRIPEKGIEVQKSFSLYDSFQTILGALEADVKIPLSLNTLQLHKVDDVTEYKQVLSPYFATLPNEFPPGHVLVRDPQQMLYQTFRGIIPAVRAEEGDWLVFKLASSLEIKFDAANGIVRDRGKFK